MDDKVKNQNKNEEALEEAGNITPNTEDKLTEEQIKEDTQMASIDDSLTAQEEIKETPESLTNEEIKDDQEMTEVSEDLKEQPKEIKETSDTLTEEQIKEDTQMASTEGINTQEETPSNLPEALTEEQIKEDQEMAPVVDPEEKLEEAKKVLSKIDPNDPAKWFIVHTYSGHENKVAKSIKQRVQSLGFENRIFDIIVPTRNTIKVSQGKKETVKEKIFPGYVLVKMVLDDESWLLIRTTQGVTAFIGAGNKPTPISDKEVEAIQKFMNEDEPLYKTSFTIGEAVKIVDGPFSDFLGTIDNIDEEKGKLKVLVSIFGRETPVELDFLQVNKL